MADGTDRAIMADRVLLKLLANATGSVTTARRLLRKAIAETHEKCPSVCRIMHLTKAAVAIRDRRIECSVPISSESTWRSGELTLESVQIPDTVMQACVGRPLPDLVRHPLITDMTISSWGVAGKWMTIRTEDAFVDMDTLRPGTSDRLISAMLRIVHPIARMTIYVRDYLDAVRRVRQIGRPSRDSGLGFLMPSILMLLIACALAPQMRHTTTSSMLVIGAIVTVSFCLFAMLMFAAIDTHYGYPSVSVRRMPGRLINYRDALDLVHRYQDGR